MVTFADSGRNNKYREAKDDDYNLERHCAGRVLKTDLSSALSLTFRS